MQVNIRLAERTKEINPSSTLAITAKAKKLKSEGHDIINFAAGEPDFDTPDFIKAAAIDAINAGFTKYTPTTGTPELKKLICEKFKKDNSLDYTPNQIVVSCGAKHSIFNALLALVGKGDEVLIPSPYWVSYPEMVRICAGTPILVETSTQDSFKITAAILKKHISPRSKVFILNNPANPTGSVYTEDELDRLSRVCVAHNILVISDEIYEKLIYDNLKHFSIAAMGKEIYDLAITINGLSKSYCMTGWRIGYLAGHQDIVDAISKLQDHSTSNPASISQKAAIAALDTQGEFSRGMRLEFQKRRDYMLMRLSRIKRMDFIRPGGAFYIFCAISGTGLDSLSFANRLLDEAGVAIIPGVGFGRGDYIRLSFATGLERIEKGMDRIEQWAQRI